MVYASYLRVTEAPASSNLALISSASAVGTPSLMTPGAPSVIKEGVAAAEAEEIKAKLEEAGASVTLK